MAISLRLSTCRGTIIATATRLPRCARNDMRKTERPCGSQGLFKVLRPPLMVSLSNHRRPSFDRLRMSGEVWAQDGRSGGRVFTWMNRMDRIGRSRDCQPPHRVRGRNDTVGTRETALGAGAGCASSGVRRDKGPGVQPRGCAVIICPADNR